MIHPLIHFSVAIIMAFAIFIGVVHHRRRRRRGEGAAHARLEDGQFRLELIVGDVKEE